MEATKILTADVLDIIFEGQNKEYGAYDLRKTYNARLKKAMGGTALICLLLIIWYYAGLRQRGFHFVQPVSEFYLTRVPETIKPTIQVPIKIRQPKIETVIFSQPKIVNEKNVPKDQKPPTTETLEEARIGNMNEHGAKYDGTEISAVESRGVIEKPAAGKEENTFVPVEIQSEFPGGVSAWTRFLERNLHYPTAASEIGIQGDVLVLFIVDKDGSTSGVEALQGPAEFREEAIRVIRSSGKWTPAIQNGARVISSKLRLIRFRLD